ncbi:MAG: hypothetical protein JF616_15510 [Fibrobacteres bacterium]|nr:hypothetical protein [Fibrobacterota bacterium]
MKKAMAGKTHIHPKEAVFILTISALLACNEGPTGADASQNAVAAQTAGTTTITTLAGLRSMSPTGHYVLGGNIDASATANAPFVPIGTFTGSFDGGVYTINNLHIVGTKYTGLFSQTDGATLNRIHLTNVTVSGSSIVGAIVGVMWNATHLTNSYVTGTVTGTSTAADVGMAVGFAGGNRGLIQRCYATGTVNGSGWSVGGFIGKVSSDGPITLNDDPRIGIYEVFTNVNVNPTIPAGSEVDAGGLIGTLMGADVRSINVVGPVRGQFAAGGIIGAAYNDGATPSTIRYMIYRGNVIDMGAGTNRAGVIGFQEGTFSRCDESYWSTNADPGTPAPSIAGGCQTGMSDATLKAPHPNPNRLLWPYVVGQIVTQDMITNQGYDQCKLASGSDTDWGFGGCSYTPLEWDLNSSTEHITLHNIPNPTVQPK